MASVDSVGMVAAPWRSGMRGASLPLGALAGVGLAFVSLTVGQSEPIEAMLTGLFGSMFLLLAWSDLRLRTIPNAIVYPSLVLALLLSWAWPERGPVDALGGGTGALIMASGIRVLNRGGLGGGDVKMAALVGSVVGYPAIVLAGAVTALTGGMLAVALLATGRARRGDSLPYGPMIALGALIALLS